MSASGPDPWAKGNYGPHADPLPSELADSLASWAAAQAAAADEPVPFALTGQAEAALEAVAPESEMTEAELEAAALADAWGPAGPPASYAEWVAEGRPAEPEAEL